MFVMLCFTEEFACYDGDTSFLLTKSAMAKMTAHRDPGLAGAKPKTKNLTCVKAQVCKMRINDSELNPLSFNVHLL